MSLWNHISQSDPITLVQSWEYLGWALLAIFALAVILLYRHGVLAYASQKKGWESLALFTCWLLIPNHNVSTNFIGLVCIIILLWSVELVITSYALHRTPFMTFDVGFWLGVLSLIHPGYLLITPFIYIQLRTIKLTSAQHTSSYILGVLVAWWLSLLIFAEPSLDGIIQYLYKHVEAFTQISLPESSKWVIVGLYAAVLTFISVEVSSRFGRAVSRYRWGVVTHLWLSWLFLLIWCAFGATEQVFFIASLFFTGASFTFLEGRDENSLFTKITVLALTVAAIIFTLSNTLNA